MSWVPAPLPEPQDLFFLSAELMCKSTVELQLVVGGHKAKVFSGREGKWPFLFLEHSSSTEAELLSSHVSHRASRYRARGFLQKIWRSSECRWENPVSQEVWLVKGTLWRPNAAVTYLWEVILFQGILASNIWSHKVYLYWNGLVVLAHSLLRRGIHILRTD